MLINNGTFFLIGIFLLISCGSGIGEDKEEKVSSEEFKQNRVSHSVDWMEGSWIDTTVFNGRVSFFEAWTKDDTDAFSGRKFQVVNGDSASPTQLSLVKTDGIYYYSYYENEDQTTFMQDSIAHQFISFQNTKDQFPQNLSYFLEGDTLFISFSGMAKGVYRSSGFKTRRVK